MAINKQFIKCMIITSLCINARAAVMRNNALMNKMEKDNYIFLEQNNNNRQKEMENYSHQKPGKVLALMQNVLCRNFPSIPCNIIIEDETLRELIHKSIQKLQHKTVNIEKTTSTPGYLTLFPVINSEELSNFVQDRDRNSFYETQKDRNRYLSKEETQNNSKKNNHNSKRTTVFNRNKKIRKFYPHKIKHKNKSNKNERKDFGDYSDEKLSMSVENPDMTLTKHHQQLHYKMDPADSPVWRIDYMKHGEPSLNKLRYEKEAKIMKTGPSVIVDENVLEQGARKDVLHPDVYIKKNFVRNTPVEVNSENID